MLALWEPEAPVLYAWAEYLRTEALPEVVAESTLLVRVPRVERRGQQEVAAAATHAAVRPSSPVAEVERLQSMESDLVSQEAQDPVSLMESLLDFDQSTSRKEFNRGIHACDVCLSELPGTECFRCAGSVRVAPVSLSLLALFLTGASGPSPSRLFPALPRSFASCGHVFCRACVKGYFESQIESGAVRELKCPNHECQRVAMPSDVKDVRSASCFCDGCRMPHNHRSETHSFSLSLPSELGCG